MHQETGRDGSHNGAGSRRGNSRLRLVVGLIVGAMAVWAVVSTAGGIGDSIDAIRHMRLTFIVLAAGLSAIRIALYGRQIAWLGRRSGPLNGQTATLLALVVYGFGAVTPAAPAEGLTIAGAELRARGRTTHQLRLTLGLSEWFAQRTFYALAALDLFVVIVTGHLALRDAWPFAVGAGIVIAALALTAAAARHERSVSVLASLIGHLRLHRPRPPLGAPGNVVAQWHAEAMAMVGPPSRRIRLAGVSALAVLCDAATLWAASHAAGFHVHPELTLLAATVGTMASWIPLLPSGLGLVEAAIPAILHQFGAPLDAALAATVAYRTVGTLIPALVGMGAIAALRANRPAIENAGPVDQP